MMKTETILEIVGKIADRISEEKLFLTELDNAIADGDHGINMSRGFEAVKEKLTGADIAVPADLFKLVGMTLVSTVGGAAGPLYGTAFMNMAKVLKDRTELSLEDFLKALESAVEGVKMRGKSTTGEKTMLDAMVPSLEAMNAAFAEGKDTAAVLETGVNAAWEGVEYTKTIAATKGRASYIGERSIGHQDPGATSYTMMLEEVKKAVV